MSCHFIYTQEQKKIASDKYWKLKYYFYHNPDSIQKPNFNYIFTHPNEYNDNELYQKIFKKTNLDFLNSKSLKEEIDFEENNENDEIDYENLSYEDKDLEDSLNF